MNFEAFFTQLHNYSPFPWQSELARLACADEWPEFIAVPTGSGKTAAIDAAVFALAVTGRCRRIFYTVNRRIIVDEAFERAQRIAAALANPRPDQPEVAKVAAALRDLSGTDSPLDCVQLRGGIYRDSTWVRSVIQPLVVSTTIDQLGSRMLFRGYGVSPSSWPIHAALTANDALVLLDEAHISRPFAQTLAAITRYRQPSTTPFAFVQMTATPPEGTKSVLHLTDADRTHDVLKPRLEASKPTRLVEPGKGKLVETLVKEAKALLQSNPRSLAVMVNRVATAKAVAAQLEGAILLIGRMRPFDRDDLTATLQDELRTGKNETLAAPRIVVSTQCLEVGADLDFDALVTECASLDALRQRFGRLNRSGRDILAQAVIVLPDDASDNDPIYGSALKATWAWLKGLPSVDFGLSKLPAGTPDLLSPAQDAPVLLPTHLDALCQTVPEPAAQPEVSLFIHGSQRASADIQLCWRNDLSESPKDWVATLSILPPLSVECLPVPIHQFRQWAQGRHFVDSGDVTGVISDEKDDGAIRVSALVWRGLHDSFILSDLTRLRPGDTVVMAKNMDFDSTSYDDQVERAYLTVRRRRVFRIPPAFPKPADAGDAVATLLAFAESPDNDISAKELPAILHQAACEMPDIFAPLADFAAPIRVDRYPGERGVILSCAGRAPNGDDGDDTLSHVSVSVPLSEHHDHLRAALPAFAPAAAKEAASHHDLGKADERFQAMLLGGDLNLVWAQDTLLAKSPSMPNTLAERERALRKSTLPQGFRHEMLSVQLAQKLGVKDDLTLHLIAAHHGYARPFAPPVQDDDPPPVEVQGVVLNKDERIAMPAHRLDSGIAERFWSLTRKHSWWGLAYLETILRLADWQTSAEENP